jgi:diadenosine tetraphosphate (Ap4A) HIT family hydrolase
MSTLDTIGSFLARALPQAGSLAANILGGNLPGAIGEVMGWLGGATGSSDPAAILAKLQGDPAALAATEQAMLANQARLKELDNQVSLARIQQGVAQAQADLAALQAVNASMQAEGKTEHWVQYAWRPAVGFAFAAAFLAVAVLCCLLAWEAVRGANPAALGMIPLLTGAFVPLFGVPAAILGVAAWHRGVMQVEQARAVPSTQAARAPHRTRRPAHQRRAEAHRQRERPGRRVADRRGDVPVPALAGQDPGLHRRHQRGHLLGLARDQGGVQQPWLKLTGDAAGHSNAVYTPPCAILPPMKFRVPLIVLALVLAAGFAAGGLAFHEVQERPLPAPRLCLRFDCSSFPQVLGLLASLGIHVAPRWMPGFVERNRDCIALDSPRPEAPIDYVFFPRRDIADIFDLEEADQPMLAACLELMGKVAQERGIQQWRLETNGPGHQSIGYLHLHLLADKAAGGVAAQGAH